jgi:hypothetical protein
METPGLNIKRADPFRPFPFMLSVVLLLTLAAPYAAAQYISSDTYTRYELLAPETHQFRIYYEVTEVKGGQDSRSSNRGALAMR